MIEHVQPASVQGQGRIRSAWSISQPLAYALAVALTMATLLLRLALGFKIGDAPLLLLFTFPIMISAYLGGLGPGLVSMALATLLANYVLLPPQYAFSLATRLNIIQTASLLATGALISVLSEVLHRTRRRAEASRRLQAVTLASISDALITTDAQGRVTFLNPAAERLTGWPQAEAIGHPLDAIFRVVDEHSQAPLEDPATQVLGSGEATGLAEHILLLSSDGRQIPIEGSGAPIRQASGATEGVVLVFRDIDERKHAEQALRQSEARLRLLAEASRAFAAVGADYHGLLDQIVMFTSKQLGATGIVRMLSDDQQWLDTVALYDQDPAKQEIARKLLGHMRLQADDPNPFMAVIRTGHPLFIPVIDPQAVRASLSPELWSAVEQFRPHSTLSAPLRIQGQIAGSLSFTRFGDGQPAFTEDDLRLAQDLADRAALAIANARLLAQLQRDLAERQRIEAALRDSEERLRTVTETARVGMVIVDQAHRYRYANRAYADMFHLPSADIVGQRVADVLAPVYETQIQPRLERAFGGEQVSYELVVPPAILQAEPRHYAVTYEPGGSGSNIVVVVVVDITTRKQAEAQLRYQANLLAQVSDAIISTDISFTIKSWNAAAEALYGWPAHEVIGRSMSEVVPTEHLDSSMREIQAAFLRDGAWRGEVMQQRRDGSARTILSSVVLLRDGAGTPEGAVAVNRDITERKRAELALRESEQRFATTFRASPAAMLITRQSDGNILDVNTSYQRLLGYTRKELVGKPGATANIYTSPEQRAGIIRLLHEQGSLRDHELTLRTKSGELRTVLSSLESLELGGETCLLGSMVDITARKQAEQALKRSAARLRVLAEASRAFAEVGTEYQAVLKQVARTAAEVLDTGCVITLADEQELYLHSAAIYDTDPQKLELLRQTLDNAALPVDKPSITTGVYNSNQPLLVPVIDPQQLVAETAPEYRWLHDRLGIHSLLGVPMRAQGRTIGVIDLFRHQAAQSPFAADDLTLAQDLADRAALAIGNARLLQQLQHELAERAKAEAEARERETKLSTLLDLLPVGISILDAQRNISYTNPALKRIVALPDSALEQHTYAKRAYLDAAGRPMTADAFASARAFTEQRPIYNVETGIVTEDGSQIWTNASAVPVDFPDWRVVIVTFDITKRKQAELALQASEMRRDLALQAGQLGTWEWNPATHSSTLDATGMRLLGLTAETFSGHEDQIFAGIYPEDLTGTVAALQAAIEQHTNYDHEFRWMLPDGSISWLHGTGKFLYAADGALSGFYGIVADITERKQAEQALHRSNERLEHLRAIDQAILAERSLIKIAEAAATHIGQLIPAIRVGVLLYNAASQTVTALALQVYGAKQTATAKDLPLTIFGAAMDTVVQGQVYQVADVALLPEPPAFIRATHAEQVRAYFQVPIMAGDELIALLNVGAAEPCSFTAEHIEIAREVADQISIAIQQARLREQIACHTQELEVRVAARTAELAASNKELEAFSYSVSHDLRAPLRAIDGFTRILLEDYSASLPDEAQRYFDLVRDNAQQMGRLIDDLLAFSRLSRQPLSRRPTDPAALVRECLSELGAEQAGRQIELQVGDLPECQADPALLKQVWINLLANALKYTRRRDPAAIAIGSRAEENQTIYFVQDNGVGFDMRYSDKLFGVFQRMHRAEDYEGTGVGLAIVQRIIARHGGHIWAEAAVDQGATFYFTLEGALP